MSVPRLATVRPELKKVVQVSLGIQSAFHESRQVASEEATEPTPPSQAGWVIPQAAEKSEVTFAIILSGGATQISYEGVYSRLAAESDSSADALSIEECLKRVRKHRARDYDFKKHFAAMPCPALWLYGDRDRSNPSQLCIELIESIAQKHDKDFRIARFPEANHGLWQCRLGGSAEYPTLTQMAPGIDKTIGSWLNEKGLAARMPER